MTPADGTVRLVRAGVLSAVALAIAAGAHTLGGRGLPGPAALVLGAVPTVAAAWAATGQRCSRRRLVAVLATTQALCHVLFHAAHSAGATAALGPHARHGQVASASVAAMPAETITSLAPGPGMLAAHLFAVAVTAAVMARGEDVLWGLLTAVVPALPDVAQPAIAGVLPLVPATAPARTGRRLAHNICRRGPPFVAA